MVGTEDGNIHKCSCSYNEQYLDTYSSHAGPVYKVKWSPLCPSAFLSCGADWTIKLWNEEQPLSDSTPAVANNNTSSNNNTSKHTHHHNNNSTTPANTNNASNSRQPCITFESVDVSTSLFLHRVPHYHPLYEYLIFIAFPFSISVAI